MCPDTKTIIAGLAKVSRAGGMWFCQILEALLLIIYAAEEQLVSLHIAAEDDGQEYQDDWGVTSFQAFHLLDRCEKLRALTLEGFVEVSNRHKPAQQC